MVSVMINFNEASFFVLWMVIIYFRCGYTRFQKTGMESINLEKNKRFISKITLD